MSLPQPPATQVRKDFTAKVIATIERHRATIPAHVSAERIAQAVRLAIYRTPKLQQCDFDSVTAAALRAAALGLDLEPSLGEAYLIPRYNAKIRGLECHFQPGYQGLRKLALQTGKVFSVVANLVRSLDVFEWSFGPDLRLRHVPSFADDRGDVWSVYGVAKLSNGERIGEMMTRDEIEDIHHRSEGYLYATREKKPESGPWVTDWNEMARKTVIRRLCKALPRSAELADAIAALDEDTRLDAPPSRSVPSRPALSRTEALRHRLEAPGVEPEYPSGTPTQTYSEADDDGLPYVESELAEPGADG